MAAKVLLLEELSLSGENADTLQLLGLTEKALGNEAEAIRAMKRSLLIAPNQPHVHANLANLLSKLDLDAAEAHYMQAVRLAPDYRQALINLALLLAEQQRGEESLQILENLKAGGEPNWDENRARVLALLSLGRAEQALTLAKKALDHRHNSDELSFLMCQALAKLGRWEETIQHLHILVQRIPQNVEVWSSLGHAYSSIGRTESAKEAFSCVLAMSPFNASALQSLCALLPRELTPQTVSAYRIARVFFPESEGLQLAESDALLGCGLLDEAEATLALLFNSQIASSVKVQLAKIRIAQNRAKEAAELLKDSPVDDIAAAIVRADACLICGCLDEAKNVCDAGLAKYPLNQHLRARLISALKLANNPAYEVIADPNQIVRNFQVDPPRGMTLEEYNQALCNHLRCIHEHAYVPIGQSVRNGTQTSGHLFRDNHHSLLQHLRSEIERLTSECISAFPDRPSHPYFGRKSDKTVIKNAWSVRLTRSGGHANHVHGDGWISAVYYVSVPDECRRTHTNAGWLQFGQAALELGANDTPSFTIQPEPGMLVLFPSYLWHGVVPLLEEGERITVAMDMVPAP